MRKNAAAAAAAAAATPKIRDALFGQCLHNPTPQPVKTEVGEDAHMTSAAELATEPTENELQQRTDEGSQSPTDLQDSKLQTHRIDSEPTQPQKKMRAAKAKAKGSTSLAEDKNFYNGFVYKLGQAPAEVKAKWEAIRRLPDQDMIKEFMTTVRESKKGQYEGEFIEMCRSVTNEDTHGTKGAWESWKKVCDEIGEDALKEMVETGTMTTRLDPRLPPSSKIKYPYNQQVAHVRDVWSSLSKTTDTAQEVKRDEATEDRRTDFKQKFDSAKQNMREGNASASTSGIGARIPQTPVGQKIDKDKSERDKTVVANIRKAHSAWDRQKRNWEALVEKSAQHPNTKGCKFEADLRDLLAKGDTYDKSIMAKESKHLRGDLLDEQDCLDAATGCRDLHALMKEGSKKASALSPWFNL